MDKINWDDTPKTIRAIRKKMKLSARKFGELLWVDSSDPSRVVRAWESGENRILGPTRLAVTLLYEKFYRDNGGK